MPIHSAIRLLFMTVASVAAFALTVDARASDPACKALLDAKIKQAATPNHQYMTQTGRSRAKAEKSEIIFTSTAMYINVDGSWKRRDFSTQAEVADMREADENSRAACKYLRDENVDGETAAVFETRDEQEGGSVVAAQMWISKSSGLPLKQTIDIDVGGKFGKSHSDVRIDYANVQAPAGAK